jgi:hypothetical protein
MNNTRTKQKDAIRLEKSRVIVGPATVMSWKAVPLDDGILKEVPDQVSYTGVAILPDGKELGFCNTDVFTKDDEERVPFTNQNKIKVGSRVDIMRFHFGEGIFENFLVV